MAAGVGLTVIVAGAAAAMPALVAEHQPFPAVWAESLESIAVRIPAVDLNLGFAVRAELSNDVGSLAKLRVQGEALVAETGQIRQIVGNVSSSSSLPGCRFR